MALVSSNSTSSAGLLAPNVMVKTEATPPKTSYSIELSLSNFGVKPASFVQGFIDFELEARDGVTVSAPHGTTFNDVTEVNPTKFKVFSFIVNAENQRPVYPQSRLVLGTFVLEAPAPRTFTISTTTLDSAGQTTQEFRVEPDATVTGSDTKRRGWG